MPYKALNTLEKAFKRPSKGLTKPFERPLKGFSKTFKVVL